MDRRLGAVSILVPTYEAGLDFFVGTLGFTLIEDTPLSDTKRWVLVAPTPTAPTRLLLAKADGERQRQAIGDQSGGRVFLFLETDDFARDYREFRSKGVTFLERPRTEPYGIVAVFRDAFGNRWDLIEPRATQADR